MAYNPNIVVNKLMVQKTMHIPTLDIQKCRQHAMASSSHQEVFKLPSHLVMECRIFIFLCMVSFLHL